jgi:hypothetical protein
MAIKPATEFPSVTEGLSPGSTTAVAEIGPDESYDLRVHVSLKVTA